MAVTKSGIILKEDGHHHLSRTAFAPCECPLFPCLSPQQVCLGKGIFQSLSFWLEGTLPYLRLQEFPAVGLKLL